MLAGLLPNTFYSRPKYRFPYYHKDGKGELLYGFGGRKLYQYSIFKPLEGYFKQFIQEQNSILLDYNRLEGIRNFFEILSDKISNS